MNEYLPIATLQRLLVTLLFAFAPHALVLPWWISTLIVALVVWRALAAQRQWRMPPRSLRIALVIVAFTAVYSQFGSVSGQTAGTALLCVMTALKLAELRERRDVLVLVSLMYFALLTHFLHSQAPWTAIYLLISAVATTALLIDVQHRGALPLRKTWRPAMRLIAQSLPLMLIIFVLFPRIPGPLWGLPSDAGAARSGLSDSMAPGDIASLIESDEMAFRVQFLDAAPPAAQRYWRGPVFDNFDGRTWRKAAHSPRMTNTDAAYLGSAVAYELTLEPQRLRNVPALELSDRETTPEELTLARNGELLARRAVNERRRLKLRAYPSHQLEAQIDPRRLSLYMRLPRGYNPRTLALGQQWRAEIGDDAAIVTAALKLFREQPFRYTLQPPLLGRDSVDDFLFDTRRGFCEHYSGSFTVLMRAAGVPARIVTGYQGGSYNELGGFYTVSQSDAHAWSEIWLQGRGWVRVDPTAAVAPERVERGLAASLGASEGLPGYLAKRQAWRRAMKLRWDWLNARWDGLVLGYGPELQEQFLRRFGIKDVQTMLLALTGLVTAALTVLGLVLLRRSAPATASDPALRLWQQLQGRLTRRGYPPRTGEGPRDYVERVIAAQPLWRATLTPACAAYLRSRYLQNEEPAALQALQAAIRAVRLQS